MVDVHLVHDALLNFDVELFLGDDLAGLSVPDAVELQSLILDDLLDLPGQHDVLCLLYDDVDVDTFLDDGDPVVDHNVALFFFHNVDALVDDDCSHRCQSPDC